MLNSEATETTLFPNQFFYSERGGSDTIMNPQHYSDQVEFFLEQERECLESLLRCRNYKCVVEIGCHDGRNSKWLSDLCDRYAGIDLNESAISRANYLNNNTDRVRFYCRKADDSNFIDEYKSLSGNKIIYLPFNIVGNFVDPRSLIENYLASGFDVVMSLFNNNIETTLGRYLYYRKCFGSESVIEISESHGGVLFVVNKSFRSMAFSRNAIDEYFSGISESCNIELHSKSYGNIILIRKK